MAEFGSGGQGTVYRVSYNGKEYALKWYHNGAFKGIVTLKSDPDKQSDRFSLAVVLFRLLFINHPLEGKYSTPPCMTKELEKKYYGSEPIFIFDPNDMRNRPIPGTDKNLKLFWNIYPKYIRDLFVRAFSQEVMHKQKARVLEKEWLDVFFRLRAETGKCPYCKNEMFYTTNWEKGLEQLKKNNWFKHAIKIAIAIGEDADKTVLSTFTGTPESVITVNDKHTLKALIRKVSVRASEFQSHSKQTSDVETTPDIFALSPQVSNNISIY